MTDEHYIEWIAVVTDKIIERISLSPGEKPEAVLPIKGMELFMNIVIFMDCGKQKYKNQDEKEHLIIL